MVITNLKTFSVYFGFIHLQYTLHCKINVYFNIKKKKMHILQSFIPDNIRFLEFIYCNSEKKGQNCKVKSQLKLSFSIQWWKQASVVLGIWSLFNRTSCM